MNSFESSSYKPLAKIVLEVDIIKADIDNAHINKLFGDAYGQSLDKTTKAESLFKIIAQEALRALIEISLLQITYRLPLIRFLEPFYYLNRMATDFAPPLEQPNYYPEHHADNYFVQPQKSFHSFSKRPQLHESSANSSVNFLPDSSLSHDLVLTARQNLGRPLWAFSNFASLCQLGYLGCAATVSELLQIAGLKLKGSASVAELVNELSNLGWHKIKIFDKNQFHPGDIVYGLNGNHAHIGIISAVDKDKVLVCDNSSSSGVLKERTIESGGSFTPNGRFAGNLYVMRQG